MGRGRKCLVLQMLKQVIIINSMIVFIYRQLDQSIRIGKCTNRLKYQ